MARDDPRPSQPRSIPDSLGAPVPANCSSDRAPATSGQRAPQVPTVLSWSSHAQPSDTKSFGHRKDGYHRRHKVGSSADANSRTAPYRRGTLKPNPEVRCRVTCSSHPSRRGSQSPSPEEEPTSAMRWLNTTSRRASHWRARTSGPPSAPRSAFTTHPAGGDPQDRRSQGAARRSDRTRARNRPTLLQRSKRVRAEMNSKQEDAA